MINMSKYDMNEMAYKVTYNKSIEPFDVVVQQPESSYTINCKSKVEPYVVDVKEEPKQISDSSLTARNSEHLKEIALADPRLNYRDRHEADFWNLDDQPEPAKQHDIITRSSMLPDMDIDSENTALLGMGSMAARVYSAAKMIKLLGIYRPMHIPDEDWQEFEDECISGNLNSLADEDQMEWECYPTKFTIGYWSKFFDGTKKYTLKLPNGSSLIVDTLEDFEDLVFEHHIENPILIRTETLDGGGRRKGRKRKGKRRPKRKRGNHHPDCSPGNVYEISALLTTSASGTIDTIIALNNPQQILAGTTAIGAQDLADNWDAYSVKRVSMSTQIIAPLSARQGEWTLIVDHDSPPPTTTINQALMLTYTNKRTYSSQASPRWSVTPRKLSQALYISAPAADPEPATIVQKGKYDWATPPANGFMYIKLTGGPASTTIGTMYIRVHVTAWYKRRQSLTAVPDSLPIPLLPSGPEENLPQEVQKAPIVYEEEESESEENVKVIRARKPVGTLLKRKL